MPFRTSAGFSEFVPFAAANQPIISADSGSLVMGGGGGTATLTAYYTSPRQGRVNDITGTMATEGSDRVLNVDSGPGFDPQGYVGQAGIVDEQTIQWARAFVDETALEVGQSQPASENFATAKNEML